MIKISKQPDDQAPRGFDANVIAAALLASNGLEGLTPAQILAANPDSIEGIIQVLRRQQEALTEVDPKEIERAAQITTLKARYESNVHKIPCHDTIAWSTVEARLRLKPQKLDALIYMEKSGGQPDLLAYEHGWFVFTDFSADVLHQRPRLPFYQAAASADANNYELLRPRFHHELSRLGVQFLNEDGTDSRFWLGYGHCDESEMDKRGKAYYGYYVNEHGRFTAQFDICDDRIRAPFLCQVRV